MSNTTPSTVSADLPEDAQSSANKRRSSRACDQCRRTKSKCRKSANPDEPCSNCVSAGLKCTYQGPSYKRGPPKGYINAIEQRLHQVEAILGAIIQSSDARSRGIISDLKTDPIAREIINRVDGGPYGSAARASSSSSRPVDFTSTIRKLKESQDSRTQRDSRVKRENVSSSLHDVPAPTIGWLRKLEDILEGNSRVMSQPKSSTANGVPKLDISSAGFTAKDEPYSARTATTDSEYAESEEDYIERREEEEAVGRLSVDEHNEIRYHNESSGMELLDKLTADSSERNMGGIWMLPMARTWPYAEKHLANIDAESDPINIVWPNAEHQKLLIELYFTYAHPDIPVIHKPSFLALCDQQSPGNGGSKRSKLQQKLFQLLLLSIFTVSSRFNENEMPKPKPGNLWEAGCDYLSSARSILNSVLHMSSLTTCQALIILAYREFGLGSFEQGSLFIGIAIRMAQDLGLHRSADRWQRFGKDIFSEEQKQERKHVWWACNIEEKLIACSLGNPIGIQETTYDTELPIAQAHDHSPLPEDIEPWRPHPSVQSSDSYQTLSYTLSVFQASSLLSEITGRIVDNIYTIRQKPLAQKLALLLEYDTQLNTWATSLPKYLQLNLTDPRAIGPNVLRLHVQHSAAVILLHRKFLPKMPSRGGNSSSTHGIDGSREFSICQEAAIKVTELVSIIRDSYTLQACSAHLPSCLLSAGIMHVASLAMQQGDTAKAYTSLFKTLQCLKEMEHVWPSALRWYELLRSAFSRFEASSPQRALPVQMTNGHDLFGDYNHGGKDVQSRMMAQLLGLEFPGIDDVNGSTANGHLPQPGTSTESQGNYTPNLSDGLSDSDFTPDMQQWMASYPDASIPLHGYDFQSFT